MGELLDMDKEIGEVKEGKSIRKRKADGEAIDDVETKLAKKSKHVVCTFAPCKT